MPRIERLRMEVLQDMSRDPEGHYWANLPGERRLPPVYVSQEETPEYVAEQLRRFIGGIAGLDVSQFEIRHNWADRTFNFVRWIAATEPWIGDIALYTWIPVELDSWLQIFGPEPPAKAYVFHSGVKQWAARMDLTHPLSLNARRDELGQRIDWRPRLVEWWRKFLHSGVGEDLIAIRAHESLKQASRTQALLAGKVSTGQATEEEVERYEDALRIADPDGGDAYREAAEYYQKAIARDVEAAGI